SAPSPLACRLILAGERSAQSWHLQSFFVAVCWMFPPTAPSQRCFMKTPATAPNVESLPSIRPLLAQYLFDSLHDWHLKILLVAAIIRHLAHIFFKRLQIKHSVVAFGIVVTAEPRGDEPRLTDFVMHELVTVDFRNVDCHLGLGRPGGPKGNDGYQGDADALPWHKTVLSRNRNFRKATHRLYQRPTRKKPRQRGRG